MRDHDHPAANIRVLEAFTSADKPQTLICHRSNGPRRALLLPHRGVNIEPNVAISVVYSHTTQSSQRHVVGAKGQRNALVGSYSKAVHG
eukprot:2609941-Pyramimonas_sp.AAC.2